MSSLLRNTAAGLRLMIVMTVLLGVGYPLLVAGLGRVVAPDQASGSLVTVDGRVVGSVLIGQSWSEPDQLWGRPSAAGDGYDAGASAGSNAGPNDAELVASIQQRRQELAQQHGVAPGDLPADAVTASGSGLDPHVSPEWAELQVPRIAAARDVDPDRVRAVIAQATGGRLLGFLGEPGVDVLAVNVALEQLG